MQRSVLIDPYMFYIVEEQEILDNLNFFETVIKLAQKRKICLCIYKEWYDYISNRGINPFPIGIQNIHNKNLKEKVLLLNEAFCKALPSQFIPIDIDSCSGEQEFKTNKQSLIEDPYYYEMLSTIVTSCYSDNEFDSHVLVGRKKNGLQCGDEFDVSCLCQNGKFNGTYFASDVSVFRDYKDQAFEELKKIVLYYTDLKVEVPEVKRAADHHDPTQHKSIVSFGDFESKTKSVLKLLRYFGLYKIILKDYHNDNSEKAGTIIVKNIDEFERSDVVCGDLYFKNGMKRTVDLYFPSKIGGYLCMYTNNRFEYENTLKLKENLCLN